MRRNEWMVYTGVVVCKYNRTPRIIRMLNVVNALFYALKRRVFFICNNTYTKYCYTIRML